MQKHSDEALVAYLDGELDAAEQRDVEAWLDADPAVRDRLSALAQSTDLVRGAYADIVNEPVPERLLAAARGETYARRGQRPGRIRGPARRAGPAGRCLADADISVSPRPRRCSASLLAEPALMSGWGCCHEAARRNKRSLPRPRRSASGSIMPPPPTSWRSMPETVCWSMSRPTTTRARRCSGSARTCRRCGFPI